MGGIILRTTNIYTDDAVSKKKKKNMVILDSLFSVERINDWEWGEEHGPQKRNVPDVFWWDWKSCCGCDCNDDRDTIFNNCCARKILCFALLDFPIILVKERLLTIPILNMGQLNLGGRLVALLLQNWLFSKFLGASEWERASIFNFTFHYFFPSP